MVLMGLSNLFDLQIIQLVKYFVCVCEDAMRSYVYELLAHSICSIKVMTLIKTMIFFTQPPEKQLVRLIVKVTKNGGSQCFFFFF